jgi:hypothetical protein
VTSTLIVSRDTIGSLLEAHASMAAWYYQLSNALRAAGASVEPPDEQLRLAFVQQIGTHFPDLGEVARSIDHPRPYIPPPAFVPPPGTGTDVPSAAGAGADAAAATASPAGLEPPLSATATAGPQTDATTRSAQTGQSATPRSDVPPSTPPHGAVPPPPLVDPKKVRYE